MKLINHLKIATCLLATVAFVGCASPGSMYTRSTGGYIDDKATSARVKSALGKDSLVKASEVNVSTFRGNVHLTGFVDHPVQKERAAQIARNVEGVEWFKNDIIVKTELPTASGQQISEPSGAGRDYPQQGRASSGSGWQKGRGTFDSTQVGVDKSVRSTGSGIYESSGTSNDLTQRINTQLRSDTSLAAQNVQVQAAPNGKVTLRGTVSSRDEKNAIEKRVKSIQGVNNVDNQLQVANQ